jgi:hypothetical protein
VPALVLCEDPELVGAMDGLVESILRVQGALGAGRGAGPAGAVAAERGALAACSTLRALADFLERAVAAPAGERLASLARRTARDLRTTAAEFENCLEITGAPRGETTTNPNHGRYR